MANGRYNEQFFRGWGRPGPLVVGTIVIVLVLVGLYLAFAKSIPFTSPGYEVKATFADAVNIATKSPVRIAGVNVGEVTNVEQKGDNAEVTFTVDDEGRPIHEDASAQIRPRLFLEGNFFIDLDPGTPGSKEMPDNGSIPVTRTATSVQVFQVLQSLQIPERGSFQRLLVGLGKGLNAEPRPQDDATFEPSVQGLTAGEALNEAYSYSEEASRGTAIVAEAFIGEERNDVPNWLRGLGRVSKVLVARQDDLKGFVSNFNTFTGALASESENLSETIERLGPTLRTARGSFANLNRTLPALRGYAIAARPGIAEIPATITAARPWTAQMKPLLSKRELGGLTTTLRQSTPYSAKSIESTVRLLPQLKNFSLCVAENLVPTGDQVLDDGAYSTGSPARDEFLYAAVNSNSESQNFDGNGPYLRIIPGGGPLNVRLDDPNAANAYDKSAYGSAASAPEGTRPALGTRPPLVNDQLCHTQDVPDLNGAAAAVGAPNPVVYP